MYAIRLSSKFRRDIRRCKKQSKDMQLFKDVDAKLTAGTPLPKKNRDYDLSGNWNGCRECHLESD